MTKDITIFHSPDADDAFMFYGLTQGGISYPGYRFSHELCDIETLNHRSLNGSLDVTAVSVHAYAYLKNQYAILTSGASMGGQQYGPRLVARSGIDLKDGVKRRIGIPGPLTSATLALKLYMKEQGIDGELIPLHFETIQDEVTAGKIDVGLIIHEGQITHARDGFTMLKDLGEWWWARTGLPLPLGVNIVNKRLGEEGMRAAGTVLKKSILYSLKHRKEALEYALSYGRGLSLEDADTFVAMYVNDYTVDLGPSAKLSIQRFLEEGHREGFLPTLPEIEFIDLKSVEL